VVKRLTEQPDVTLRALLAELAERGIKVSYYAIWHFFEHEGVSFKKSLYASEQGRPDGARRGRNGRSIKGRDGLSRRAWSASMRCGPRPTRRAPTVAHREAKG
jgi:hypothetical protein